MASETFEKTFFPRFLIPSKNVFYGFSKETSKGFKCERIQATIKTRQTKGKNPHIIFLGDAVQDEIKKYYKYSNRLKSHKDALLNF